jgi:Rhodopirellula transposase DDE domain
MVTAADREAEVARKWELLSPFLDERQRRLWMGAEAREGGHGGVNLVARATAVARSTVTRGLQELDEGEAAAGRARRPGGGRKRVSVTDPGLVAALRALVDPDARGDPESPLEWTIKSVRTLADELTAAGHKVSAPTVARLLKDEGFSLQANAKVTEGRQHPDRDAQFRYLNDQAKDHQAAGDPVISVDAKKKENVGQFKQAGRTWRPKGQPEKVQVHDFIDKDKGKVTPYGVYDIGANSGWVSVGTDHDTAAFAVSTIRTWWEKVGRDAYPGASRLLITADGGGSNGDRTRLWKTELARFTRDTGLAVTVCHFPPGTSKWNKIEHRLFSHISLAWRGRPLTSHEVIVNTIAATTTRTGLTVTAELDTAEYPKGVKISDKQMRELDNSGALRRHEFHGEWNYTLVPPSQLRMLLLNAYLGNRIGNDCRCADLLAALGSLP